MGMGGWCPQWAEVIVQFHSHLCFFKIFSKYGDVEKEKLNPNLFRIAKPGCGELQRQGDSEWPRGSVANKIRQQWV